MPMSAADLERKVLQLDGDVQAIYEMISRIDGTLRRQLNRLEEISLDLANMTARLDGHDEQFISIDKRFDAVDKRFDAVDRRLDAMDKRLDGHDARFDAVDDKLDRILEILDRNPE